MLATPVAPLAEPGTITVELRLLDAQFGKLLRFRNLKLQLAELRTEYERLEKELFAEGAL